MGMIPKSTTAERKIWKNITMSRIIGLMIAGVMGFILGSVFCTNWGALLMVAGNLIGFFILSSHDIVNPRQKFYVGYQSWLKSFVKKKVFYGDETEEAEKYYRREEQLKYERESKANRKLKKEKKR